MNPDQRRSTARMREGNGFSLIELVVTLAVIGLLVSVSVPVFGDFLFGPGSEATDPARAFLVDAARRSRLHASEVTVTIAPETGRYLLEERRSGEPPLIDEGVLSLPGILGRGPRDRFHVFFNPIGIGVGDTLHFSDARLVVAGMDGTVTLIR